MGILEYQLRLIRRTKLKDRIIGYIVTNRRLYITLELPWKSNQRNISCIPAGTYELDLHNSKKFGVCFKVLNVRDRSDILIHPGNYPQDTQGCILIGSDLDNSYNLTESRKALSDLMEELSSYDKLTLKIEEDF